MVGSNTRHTIVQQWKRVIRSHQLDTIRVQSNYMIQPYTHMDMSSLVQLDDNYAICYSVRHNLIDIVQWLLQHGASMTARNQYPVKVAVRYRHMDILYMIMSTHSAFVRTSVYKMAAILGRIDIIEEFSHLHLVSHRMLLHYGLGYARIQVGEWVRRYDPLLVEQHVLSYPLYTHMSVVMWQHPTSINGSKRVSGSYIKWLCDRGVQVDDNSLHVVVMKSSFKAVRVLLTRYTFTFDEKQNALRYAILLSKHHCMKLLITHGAQVVSCINKYALHTITLHNPYVKMIIRDAMYSYLWIRHWLCTRTWGLDIGCLIMSFMYH